MFSLSGRASGHRFDPESLGEARQQLRVTGELNGAILNRLARTDRTRHQVPYRRAGLNDQIGRGQRSGSCFKYAVIDARMDNDGAQMQLVARMQTARGFGVKSRT